MSITRVRVVAKPLSPRASRDDQKRNFDLLLRAFRTQVKDSGILTRYRELEAYESKGQKRRRKQREADLRRSKEQNTMKTKLREHFG